MQTTEWTMTSRARGPRARQAANRRATKCLSKQGATGAGCGKLSNFCDHIETPHLARIIRRATTEEASRRGGRGSQRGNCIEQEMPWRRDMLCLLHASTHNAIDVHGGALSRHMQAAPPGV